MKWSDGMKGFVLFDLDGTLLNGGSKVDKATAEAIQTLKDNGKELLLSQQDVLLLKREIL